MPSLKAACECGLALLVQLSFIFIYCYRPCDFYEVQFMFVLREQNELCRQVTCLFVRLVGFVMVWYAVCRLLAALCCCAGVKIV